MSRLLLASRNRGKLREMRRLLPGFTLETLDQHPEVPEVEETGNSFEENAALKAVAAARASGLWSLGEDSGLEVDALGGAPGVHSARYAGAPGAAEANNQKLVAALSGCRNRGARYVCVLVLANPKGERVATARGLSEGSITETAAGGGGFGYDPYFIPEGKARTNAELSPDEKDAISHRGAALRRLLPILAQHLREA